MAYVDFLKKFPYNLQILNRIGIYFLTEYEYNAQTF